MATAAKSKAKAPARKKRTKGTSDKIRALAAMSVGRKVGYLTLADLTGGDDPKIENAINELPRKQLKPGDTVYPSNAKSGTLYLLKSGRIQVTRTSANGVTHNVKTLDPGTIFGDAPSLGQGMFGTTATATEPTKLIVISPVDIDRLVAGSPEMAINILRKVGTRLVEADRQHEQAAFQPVAGRIAAMLLANADKQGNVTGQTQQQIAESLGVYRETVTNAIGEMKAEKVISVGRKRITIQDAERLRRMAAI
ncbi:MAG TPA: Crp/Fnr family transcriptional regulator [Blastocatellia bacterium]|nr:Crp/Fnr family transcriptional regulator [Blastocatellia bacterium]